MIQKSIQPFIKKILVYNEENPDLETTLPFFADGLPGIVYCETSKGIFLKPQNKRLKNFFLYGQTIKPVQLHIKGKFNLVIYQLYPYAIKVLFDINPKTLVDDCYDLTYFFKSDLFKKNHFEEKKIENILNHLIANQVNRDRLNIDQAVSLLINIIILHRGKIKISDLTKKINLSERSLQRRFIKQVGVTPKTFCKIIQFQNSLKQISEVENEYLTNIAYNNGYSDQSHFIKSFKNFTGYTPSEFKYLNSFKEFNL